jgi:hypothetical protein
MIIYFKLYQSQSPVIVPTLETAALMLGSDKSRGYCFEMICADFLAGRTWTIETLDLAEFDDPLFQVPARGTTAAA